MLAINRFCFVFLAFALFSAKLFAQQTDCPRIYKQNDTLKTDPAPALQWYKNGVKIPDAVQNWIRPDTTGDYSVSSGAVSGGYSFVANPADLRVEVFDAKLKPVAGATVSANGQTTTTDANGKAFLPNVVTGRTVIKVTQNGFFDGFTSVYKPASGNAIVKIQLEKFPASFTFQDTSARMVAAPSGLSITFPKKGFVIESTGAAYSGAVTVYFNHRAPGKNDPMFSFAMPGGDFTAIDANGETVALTSYGFFNCELRGANGEELNLAPGKAADVQFRIPESMRAAAPATVPLWSFDEAAGIWKYDSELTKHGIFYNGKVSHFSPWNCDYPSPRCTVIASAVDCNGNPAANVSLCFVGGFCGVTDSTGKITFLNVPANIALMLASSQDTIAIAPINGGETFTLPSPILAGESMLAVAYYWQDSLAVSIYGADIPIQYSLDGQNWQNQPLFTNVPFQDSVIVWIKDASGCPIKRTAFYSNANAGSSCISIQNPQEMNQYQAHFSNLLNYDLPKLYYLNGYVSDESLLWYAFNRYPCLSQLTASNVSFLPAEIGNLTALTWLYIPGVQLKKLTSLPPEIGNLSSLKSLILYDNQISSLPIEIGNLNSLTTIYLQGNQLTSLPAEIGNLNALTALSLNNNQLTSLPQEIANLADTLLSLSLFGNPIPVGDRPYYQSLLPNTAIGW